MAESESPAPAAPVPVSPDAPASVRAPAPPPAATAPSSGSAARAGSPLGFLRSLRLREDLGWRMRSIHGGICLGVVLLLWVAVTSGENPVIGPLILPGPVDVLRALPKLHFDHALVRSCLVSLFRVTAGFLIAGALAIPLGIAMGAVSRIKAFFNPVTVMGGYVPIAALVPITISWFGIDEAQKIAFLAIACFVMLLPMIVRAIDAVEEVYLQTGYTLGADAWQSIRHVLVPIALAEIYASLRLLYGVGWGYIILAEVVGADRGLGYLIQLSQRRNEMGEMYGVLLVIIALALGIDYGLRKLGQHLFPYVKEA